MIGFITQLVLPDLTLTRAYTAIAVYIAVYLIIFVLGIWTNLACTVQRIHDVGKSGWYILVPVYPFILTFTDGTVGRNKYGEDPKGR